MVLWRWTKGEKTEKITSRNRIILNKNKDKRQGKDMCDEKSLSVVGQHQRRVHQPQLVWSVPLSINHNLMDITSNSISQKENY